MKMDLFTLCDKVEATVPTARATAVPENNQVVVSFMNRPDIEVALLTPWLQQQIKNGSLANDDFSELLFSLKRIADYS